MIIGARCSDGIVLAADKGGLRGYEPVLLSKIKLIDVDVEDKQGTVLLAGAGTTAFWDEVAWSVTRARRAEDERKDNALIDVVDRISSLSIHMSARYQRNGLDERLGCVVVGLEGLYGGHPEMYYFAGAGFSKTDFVCLGSGAECALPMADLLLRHNIQTITEATQVIPFLFLLVERVNLSVGEGPDIFVLREDERPTEFPADQVRDLKMRAASLADLIPRLLPKMIRDPSCDGLLKI